MTTPFSKNSIRVFTDTFKRLSKDRHRGETWDCCIRRLLGYPDEDDEDGEKQDTGAAKCHPVGFGRQPKVPRVIKGICPNCKTKLDKANHEGQKYCSICGYAEDGVIAVYM